LVTGQANLAVDRGNLGIVVDASERREACGPDEGRDEGQARGSRTAMEKRERERCVKPL
jgi:hypothetical protein